MANFKNYQHLAKRNTFWQVIVFTLGLFSLLFISIVMFIFLHASVEGIRLNKAFPIYTKIDEGLYFHDSQVYSSVGEVFVSYLNNHTLYVWFALGFLAFFMLVIVFNFFYYRTNSGEKIAQALGGMLIDPAKKSSHPEKIIRLINVNEEIAISSRKKPAKLYLINQEAINAFAAGYGDDYVVGVTRGALKKLNREELQAVIAHEYSHIHNKDTEINLKFLALISSLFFFMVVGRVIGEVSGMLDSRSRSRNKDNKNVAIVFFISLIFLMLGWAGSLFARIMQAMISREREFLADASAVEFTRNPLGLASALRKIKEDTVEYKSKDARYNHIMFSNKLNSLFATHPDIDERITRFDKSSH